MPRLLIPFLLLLSSVAHGSEQMPIELIYDEQMDEQCAIGQNYPMKAAWVEELRGLLPELQSLWQSAAPPMIDAAGTITGKPIGPLPRRVRLSLCDIASQSAGEVVVNMRFALRSFAEQPVTLRYKIDSAFHELLHPFVRGQGGKGSGLLRKHEDETACVRNHVHLLSLQKAVLVHLGLNVELDGVRTFDSRLSAGCFKRAWEIVEESPSTYKDYVRELVGG